MDANPVLGILLHAVGGLAAASFYLPYKRVKNWDWESYWIVGGFFSWIIAPILGATLLCPGAFQILWEAPPSALFWTYFFGVLWGVGGLTFGLSVRYLGLSLGYAIALGFCAAFGTIIPPLFANELFGLLEVPSGQVTLLGVFVCLGGIAVCGMAGMRKEKETPESEKQDVIEEFNFMKGLWVAVFAGVMSACMAFAFAAGKPISDAATVTVAARDGAVIFAGLPVLIGALLGGFSTNFVWCMYLNAKNGTFKNYRDAGDSSLTLNYVFAALAGAIWYLQFFFYSMGTSQMGKYDFASWTIHMAFIIAFSNVWGILLREWKGASAKARNLIVAGILILVGATVVVGAGTYLKGLEEQAGTEQTALEAEAEEG